MKIAYIAAGAAGMYCGSCLHDNTLAAALLELGEDVLLVPTYTPLRTDEVDVSVRRVFFGGINVYLQQKFAVFRRTPWWMDRLLGSSGAARAGFAARREHPAGRAGRHDRLDASRRSGQPAQGTRKARPLAAHRRAARRGPPLELDADRHGADAQRPRRPAGRLPALRRRLVSRKARAAALRAGPRPAARASRGRRCVRRPQSLLRRFHGRLPGRRSQQGARHSARPESRRPRQANRKTRATNRA